MAEEATASSDDKPKVPNTFGATNLTNGKAI